MNKYILTLALSLSLVGCGTISIQTEQTIITAGSEAGTIYDLQNNPKDLPYFVATEQELYSVSDSTNLINETEIDLALAHAGLTNKLEDIGLTAVLTVADSYIANQTNSTSVIIKQVCGWVADGIKSGVSTSVTKMLVHKAK